MSAPAPVPDRVLVRRLWPLLAAAALGLVPFTIMANFLVAIAEDAGAGVDLIGGLRGLGGVAALIVGVAAAPLLDRLPRSTVAALALLVMGIGCGLSLQGSTAAWIVFCLLIGAGTAVLNPALSAMAADRFDAPGASARAATLVSSTMTLTAVLAAPVLALPAVVWGWQADMAAAAVVLLIVAALVARRRDPNGGNTGVGYLQAFRTVRSIPGALDVLMVSLLRTLAFMGSLAYIAAAFSERFGLGTGWFSLVWATSGSAFFLGNFFAGKLMQDRSARTLLVFVAGAVVLAAVGMMLLYTAPNLVLAWLMVAVVSASHAAIAAAVTTTLVRAADGLRGTVLSLNGAAQSVGVFAGAAIGGTALATFGWSGVGAALGGTTLIAAAFALKARRALGAPSDAAQASPS
ncbi:MFS transporter [Tsukamurella serpentis]